MIFKIKPIFSTLLNHKKKTIFAVGAISYFTNYLHLCNRDRKILHFYALEAEKYSQNEVHPMQQLKRVTVLINEIANNKKVLNLFKTNALPLLNLAGIDVNIIKVKNEEEIEKLGHLLDSNETDCIYIVGGDGTVSRVITGIMTNNANFNSKNTSLVPICIFPGGRRNLFLARLMPEIFAKQKGVRQYCESAMAVIEDSRCTVSPMKCEIIDNTNKSEKKLFYILSSISTGWFEHCQQKKLNLLNFKILQSCFIYFLEFLKRYPELLKIQLTYEEFCSGCSHCRSKIDLKSNEQIDNRSWISRLFGIVKKDAIELNEKNPIDYSKIINDKCGIKNELFFDLTNLEIICMQAKDCSKLKFQGIGEIQSRLAAMKHGWIFEKTYKNINAATAETNEDLKKLNNLIFLARKINIKFLHMPEFIKKISIAGDWLLYENYVNKFITFETTDKKLEIYLPKSNIYENRKF